MDIEIIRAGLSDRFPQWSRQINMLEMNDVLGVYPVDNDGRAIYYNSHIMRYYTEEAQSFYIAQQLLHIQLNHVLRSGSRDMKVWKKSCDAVVNAMLKGEGFEIPANTPDIPEAAELSAEDMYSVLIEKKDDEEKKDEDETEETVQEAHPDSKGNSTGGDGQVRLREIDDPGLASIISGLAEMLEPSMQLDYDWFPGSTVRDGVIPYDFRAYPVAYAEILLDTSASVDSDLLRSFVRGVMGLMQQDAVLRVGCFDTRFYGFTDIRNEKDIQKLELKGFGGTDFNVAVAAFTGDAENKIILTDGFAEMPSQRCDAVWVVYGNTTIHPEGGRVLYAKPTEEKEKHEIDFLIT